MYLQQLRDLSDAATVEAWAFNMTWHYALDVRSDGYIRRLLVHGARTVLRWRRAKPDTQPDWTDQLLARRPTNVVLVAMANKTARVAWALLRYKRRCQGKANRSAQPHNR